MKIPKKVTVMGSEMDVLMVHKDGCGGSYDAAKNIITIDPNDKNKEEVLWHEIIELILGHMCAFNDVSTGERIFTLQHHVGDSTKGSDSFATFVMILYDTMKRNGLLRKGE
jgi:hypothetical protein